jgi:protein phosphatase-4 regulatory subunit 3
LQDDKILGVVGMLERDREFPNAKASYREYLSDKTRFKHVVSFNNPEIEAKIHQTYRAQYLKDVVLARTIDDPNYSSLNSIIFFNYVAIVNFIQTDKQFLKNLFDILNDRSNSIDKRKQVIMFLHELCSVTKGLQYVYRDIFYKSLTEYGLLSIVEELAYTEDISIRLALISMLTNMLDHETALVRNYCINQMKKEGKPLIETIIDRFHSDPDSGIRSQYMDILRILLDTSTLDPNESITNTIQNKPEIDEFLDLFYEKYIYLLVKPITDLTDKDLIINKRGKVELNVSYDMNSTFFMICELLCFCIKNHSYRCKFFILKSTITEKISFLLKSKEKYIRLSALRYFRACISMKDEFYNKHLIKNSIFKSIIQMLSETERRNNLLNSACLELFVFIRVENIKSLIVHIVSNYRSILETFNYVDVFKLLIIRYEQYQDDSESVINNNTTSKMSMSSIKINDWGKTDEEEEAYFNDDEDEDESENSLTKTTEKNTEDSNRDKSEKNINPKIVLANSINGPSRGRIANPNAIVARFIRSTQPLASGLVDYPDDNDIIEEEEEEGDDKDEEMTPKYSVKSLLDTKNENITQSSASLSLSNNKKENNSTLVSKENMGQKDGMTSMIGKYLLPNNTKIRKIEFVSEKKENKESTEIVKMEEEKEEKEEKKIDSVTTTINDINKINDNHTNTTNITTNNDINSVNTTTTTNNNNNNNKAMTMDSNNKNNSINDKTMTINNNNNDNNNKNSNNNNNNSNLDNKNKKRSREELDNDDDNDIPLPIRKRINKEDDDELFLQSINRNKMKKEASKLNSNEKSISPLSNKKITLNISPKLKHTEVSLGSSTITRSPPNSIIQSHISPTSSPTHNNIYTITTTTTTTTATSHKKRLFDSNNMDEDEKEPSNTNTMTEITNSVEEDNNKTKDNKKKVDIIIHPNLKNINLKKS